MSAWARTITYDFKSAVGDGGITASSLTKGSNAGKNNSTDIFYPTELTSELQNRFAFQYREKNGNTNAWAVEKSRNGLWVNCASGIDEYMSILNLKANDVVKITIATGKLKFSNTVNAKASDSSTPEAWSYVVSDEEYTIIADGKLDLQAMKYQNGGNAHMAISKIVITTSDEETIETTPTVAITGANGGAREITITSYNTSADNGTTAYYTLDGTDPTSSSTEYTGAFSVSSADDDDSDGIVVVKAISYKTGNTSIASTVNTQNISVGETIKLATPIITLSDMTLSGDVYNGTYTFTKDMTGTIGSPTVTLEAKFNGSAIDNATYTPSTTGTITLVAKATGYDDSDAAEVTVSKVGFIRVNYIDVKDLYPNAANDNNGFSYGQDYTLIPNVTLSRVDDTKGCVYHFNNKRYQARNQAFNITVAGLTENLIAMFASSDNSTKYVMTNSDNVKSVPTNGNIKYYSLFAQPTLTQSITVSDAEWKTLVSPYSLDFTSVDGLKAYIVTGGAEGVLTKTQVKKVPAGTAMLLNGSATTYNVPVIAESAASDDVSGNKLVGVVTDKVIAAEAGYVLMASPSLGFYKNTNAFTVGANTAYLPANFDGSSARAFFLLFDDDMQTTGVNDVRSKMADVRGDFFDLQGRKVANPTKGLYIVNGKKVAIK